MRFAIAVLACVLAVANAQFGTYRKPAQYQNPFNTPYKSPATYQAIKPKPYKPYVAPSPFPVAPAKAAVSVAVNSAPVVPVPVVPVAKVAADSRSAETVKSGYDINPDGSYNYYYETNNGIAAQAQGTPRNFGGNPPVVPDVVDGSFSWVSPEGRTIYVTYVADENGYQPQSDALPVAPEIPPQIARALEYTARYAVKN